MSRVTIVRGDLFRLALTHLGDATQWSRIAALNGLSDPVLEAVAPATTITLELPGRDASKGGGLAR